MENTTKKQVKVKKYTSRAQLVEDIIQWNDLAGPATKEAQYVQTLKDIHERLLNSDAEKFPLAEFVQNHKLSQAELFLLLRISVLDLQRIMALSFFQVPNLLSKGQVFGTRQELVSILLDRKSILFDTGILTFMGNKLELRKNFLEDPMPIKKHKTKKRTLNPKHILAELNKYVIGQDEAKKKLVAGVFEHLTKCANAKDGQVFNKSNIFISGPTGTGKTYMCQCLARILKIPFVHADASQYTQTGYVGMDVSDILRPLIPYASAGKMPIAIVFIDEIDKIRQGSEGRNGIASTNVQVELLRLIESRRYRLQEKSMFRNVMNFDISQVLFVVGGAFESLQVKHADKSVGFTHAPIVKKETLTADDFIAYGMLPELIGRFSYFVQLKGLEKEDLRKILFNPHNGPLQQYKDLLHTSNKVSAETLETLLNNACERHLGARGLHQQVGQLFQEKFLEQPIQIEI